MGVEDDYYFRAFFPSTAFDDFVRLLPLVLDSVSSDDDMRSSDRCIDFFLRKKLTSVYQNISEATS